MNLFYLVVPVNFWQICCGNEFLPNSNNSDHCIISSIFRYFWNITKFKICKKDVSNLIISQDKVSCSIFWRLKFIVQPFKGRYLYCLSLIVLEIKLCGLGSRIRDMEAESYNFIGGYLDDFCLVKVPKCALDITFLASNSLHNDGGQNTGYNIFGL